MLAPLPKCLLPKCLPSASPSASHFDDIVRINRAITELNDNISALPEIRRISEGIQATLEGTVGHTYSPKIDIKSALPEEIHRLLQGLALRVGDPKDGYQGDITELSLGGANLIYLSLKLLEYESKISEDRVSHFLLIEEPEAHIHTHIQKTLFEKYGYQNTQVIVSTHSTHISAATKVRSVNVLSRLGQESAVFQPGAGLDAKECNRVERYLDAVRTTLLFAKGVMLVEGDAELILIPALIKAVFGISLDELGASLISMSAAIFTNVAVVFHDDRIQRRCAIVTDKDTSIVELPEDEDKDDDFQKKCRASQESGELRSEKLDDFAADNRWVKPFYASHTFEVDLLQAGNDEMVSSLLDEIYSRERDRTESSEKLGSTDVAIAGKEVLRLAKKVGKGWFSLLLAEKVSPEASIPEYLLSALAFACQDSIDSRTLKLIGLHRLKTLDPKTEDFKSLAPDKFIAAYSAKFETDPLTHFVNCLPEDSCDE